MSEQATPTQLNRFVAAVDEFYANAKRLNAPQFKQSVYATRDAALIADYERTVNQARVLSNTIGATVGAWNTAKAAWSSVTDTTSTVIGDAIDEIRSWFGYQPAGDFGAYVSIGNLSGLAAGPVALPAAAWIAGILGAVYLVNKAMRQIFVSMQASRMQREDPTLSREQALVAATRSTTSPGFFGIATVPLLLAAGVVVFLVIKRR